MVKSDANRLLILVPRLIIHTFSRLFVEWVRNEGHYTLLLMASQTSVVEVPPTRI
jgi:hypothetical protein